MNQVNKENALKIIRYIQDNVEGLKEPTKGCIIGICRAYPKPHIEYNTIIESDEERVVFHNDYEIDWLPINRIAYIVEIIGHEVQLNHLLLAILLCNHNVIVSKQSLLIQDSIGLEQFKSFYSLEKTVQENLESNPEMCNYFIKLFGL